MVLLMPRRSAGSIKVDSNVRCLRIYPTAEFEGEVRDLETVGIRLSREHAVHLARVLLAVSQDWDVIDLTAYRFERRRSDSTYHVTVTSNRKF
jgi:hypothetical protein